MTTDGMIRIVNLRKMELQKELDYLRDPTNNPPSRHEGETVNEYANGLMRAYEKEIEFIDKLFKLSTGK